MITTQFIPSAIAPYVDNYAIDFNGTSQSLYNSSPSFTTDAAGAVRLFFNADALAPSNDRVVILGMGKLSPVRYLEIELNRQPAMPSASASYIGVRYYDGTTAFQSYCPVGVGTSAWYSLVFNSDATMYLNGVLQSVITPGTNLISGTWWNSLGGSSNFFFGAQGLTGLTPNKLFNGKVNNTVMYNRVLTSTEAIALSTVANMGSNPAVVSPSSASAIVSQWNFENNALDSVGSNNMAVVGSPTYVTP